MCQDDITVIDIDVEIVVGIATQIDGQHCQLIQQRRIGCFKVQPQNISLTSSSAD